MVCDGRQSDSGKIFFIWFLKEETGIRRIQKEKFRKTNSEKWFFKVRKWRTSRFLCGHLSKENWVHSTLSKLKADIHCR